MERRHKLVVLEDNEVFAALITAALEDEFDIEIGHNGLQGIELCRRGGVDAVVTDIGMPEMDGLQMLKAFARDPQLSRIPVVVVTATHFATRDRSEVACFRQVRKILYKSNSMEELAVDIKKALRESGALQSGN